MAMFRGPLSTLGWCVAVVSFVVATFNMLALLHSTNPIDAKLDICVAMLVAIGALLFVIALREPTPPEHRA